MNKRINRPAMVSALALLAFASSALAGIPGLDGTEAADANCAAPCFKLTARAGHIMLGDGNSILAWGYSPLAAPAGEQPLMQYPGPTLIVNEGDTVTVQLSNDQLPLPVSIVFPGQTLSEPPTGGSAGLMTQEVGNGSTVTYRFKATQPGTYLYHSGTRPELEVEMGLVGALIVRPAGFSSTRTAYGSDASAYDREYLYLLTEIDRAAHEAVEQITLALAAPPPANGPAPTFDSPPAPLSAVDPATFHATLWFINGRNGPDTLLNANVGWLPTQPYNATTRMHPGERVLMRIIGGGRDLHPFHHHGNNAWLIAHDGRLLESLSGATPAYPDFNGIPDLAAKNAKLPDQAVSNFTIQIVPGSTYDALFTWTGKGLGWDVYGHSGPESCDPGNSGFGLQPGEDPTSHCAKFAFTNGDTLPVTLPEQQAMAFGGYWSGSPYLGGGEALPPLQGGLNPSGGFTFMWHSHTERELTNDDIFPGGMMTMMIIEHPDTAIAD